MPNPTITTLLAFDFGLARIGVASGQTITRTASPLKILQAKDGEPDWLIINDLIDTWRPDALIVGKPLHMDGTTSDMQTLASAFARELETRFNRPVYQTDERLSSSEVTARLHALGDERTRRRSKHMDDLAACVILETWLNAHQDAQ